MTVTPANLGTYLGITDIDTNRAQMILDDVLAQALAVVTVGTPGPTGPTWTNLPNGGEGIVRAAAGRLYLNAAGVTAEGVGPFHVQRPAPTGSMLSRREKRELRELAGRPPAFTADVTPATAMVTFVDPLAEPDVTDAEEFILDIGLP